MNILSILPLASSSYISPPRMDALQDTPLPPALVEPADPPATPVSENETDTSPIIPSAAILIGSTASPPCALEPSSSSSKRVSSSFDVSSAKRARLSHPTPTPTSSFAPPSPPSSTDLDLPSSSSSILRLLRSNNDLLCRNLDSTKALDQRLERLEVAQAALRREIDGIRDTQDRYEEARKAEALEGRSGVGRLEAGQAEVGAKVEALQVGMKHLQDEMARQAVSLAQLNVSHAGIPTMPRLRDEAHRGLKMGRGLVASRNAQAGPTLHPELGSKEDMQYLHFASSVIDPDGEGEATGARIQDDQETYHSPELYDELQELVDSELIDSIDPKQVMQPPTSEPHVSSNSRDMSSFPSFRSMASLASVDSDIPVRSQNPLEPPQSLKLPLSGTRDSSDGMEVDADLDVLEETEMGLEGGKEAKEGAGSTPATFVDGLETQTGLEHGEGPQAQVGQTPELGQGDRVVPFPKGPGQVAQPIADGSNGPVSPELIEHRESQPSQEIHAVSMEVGGSQGSSHSDMIIAVPWGSVPDGEVDWTARSDKDEQPEGSNIGTADP